jgi:hypothetical protein
VVPEFKLRKFVGPAKVTVVPNKYVLLVGSAMSLKTFASFLDTAANNKTGNLYRFDHAFNMKDVSNKSVRIVLTIE